MLTFDFENVCTVSAAFATDAPIAIGKPGSLAVALAAQAPCSVVSAQGEVHMPPASLLLTGAPVRLRPQPGGHITILTFAGTAAAEAAASLSAPALIPPGACPGAGSTLQQLYSAHRRLSKPQLAAQSFSFLCQLATRTSAPSASAMLVEAAAAEIHAHFAEVYGVQELADGLQVSKSHLIRCFTAAMGISPGRYLTQVRIANAQRLLLRGGFPLEAIAGLCGFSSGNYLCKVFRQTTGQTPAAWRARNAPAKALPAPSEWEQQAYL